MNFINSLQSLINSLNFKSFCADKYIINTDYNIAYFPFAKLTLPKQAPGQLY